MNFMKQLKMYQTMVVQIVTISFKLLYLFLEAIYPGISKVSLRCTTVPRYEGPEPHLSVTLE